MTELIKKDCIIGVNTSVKSVHALDSNKVLYCSSNHVVIWMKSEKKQTFVHHCSPRERIQHIELCSSRRTIAIVIIGQDGAYIIFYDASTLQRKKVIQPNDGIPERILGLSFSKDGKECLILGDEPEYVLSIWNVEKIPSILASVNLATPSGKEIRQASLCPSDGRLVSVSGNGIIRFFRIIDNIFRPVTVKLRGKQQDYIQHCWLKNDSIMLATTNELIVVCNFEMETAIPMEGWDQDLVSISPLARGILIGGSKGSIRLYHAVVENSFTELKLTRSISFDEDANVLAFDSIESENVAICLVGSGRICTVLLSNFVPLHAEDAVSIVDIVPSLVQMEATGNQKIFLDICSWKTTLAIGTPNNTIRIWDYSNKMFDLLHLCKDEIVSLSLHPMGLQVLICTETGVELSAVNYSSLSLRWRHDLSTNGGSCFSNGGHYFALLIGEFVQVYDTFTQNLISTLRGHTAYVQSVCWKDDDVQIATIGRDGVICTWDTWTGDRTSRSEGHIYSSAFFTGDFSTAFVNSDNGIKVFDLNSKVLLNDYEWPSDATVLACASNIIVFTSLDPSNYGQVWIRNIYEKGYNSRGSNLTLHSLPVRCARISPERECVFTTSDDGSICCSTLNHRLFPHREYKHNEDVGPITLKEFLVPGPDIGDTEHHTLALRQEVSSTQDMMHNEDEFEAARKQEEEDLLLLKAQMQEEEEEMATTIRTQNEKMTKVKDVKLRGEMQDLGVKHLDIVNEIEDQAESELLVEQQTYESATHQEVSASRRLTEEIDITWKKHTTLVKDSEEHRESILSLQETHQELNEDIKNLTQQQRSMEEDGQNQHISIIQIEREIQISSEENDTIERSKMNLLEVICNMKEELIQKNFETQRLTEKKTDSTNAKQKELDLNETLRIQLQQEQLKLNSLKKQYESALLQNKDLEKESVAAEFKMARAKEYAEDLPSLKRYLISLSRDLHTAYKQQRRSEELKYPVTENRERLILQKRVNNIEEVADRKSKLHIKNMCRMKRNQGTLSLQLHELQTEIKCLTDKKAKIRLAKKDESRISTT
eukprot:scaffold5005_cov267-Chaetoceros_neogracile.AAC.14